MNTEQQLTLLQTTQAHLERENDQQKYAIAFDPFRMEADTIGIIVYTPTTQTVRYFTPGIQPQVDKYGFLI